MDKIEKLVKFVVEQFAEYKDKIEYKTEEKETAIEITVLLEEADMGKVIGKQGKIAKALRTLVKASTPRESKKYLIEIKEKV
ncbi:MAG: KH domain-containing protein [Clostridia bacterium]|nr:KH domain-containing protein [Clostridia bacterium]